MITIDDVKVTLDNNPYLEKEIKENIKELLDIFNTRFPDVNLQNLNNRIGNLKIEKSNKFINKRVSHYNLNTNILEFNIDEINKGYDMKYILMFELLNIITANNVQTGFNYNDKFIALNAGYTAILANNLVGNDSDIPYLEDEIISTNLIAGIIGEDVLYESYFKNNANLIMNALLNEGVEI